MKFATLLKKRLRHRSFPVNFVKFLRTPFFIEHLWWLLLWICLCYTYVFENDPAYMFGRVLNIPWVLNMSGLEYTRFVNLQGLWNKVSQGSGFRLLYAKVLNVLGVLICYSYEGLWIKYFIVSIWQDSKYATFSKYARVLNVPRVWIFQGNIRFRKNYAS